MSWPIGPLRKKSLKRISIIRSRVVFAALMELIPPGEQRDKMLQAYVDFISNSNLQQQSPWSGSCKRT